MLQAVTLFICVSLTAQTQRIKFMAPFKYPEGTAYYPAQKSFFVSSVTTATIGKVDENGNYTVFYDNPSLKSSYGMKVDVKRNRLWVCTGDANYSKYSEPSTYKKLIRLIGLDLSSGQKINDIDLSGLTPGNHFANDLTLDAAGNIYITDSYAAAIYKVDLQFNPTMLVKSDLFKTVDVGLNGIVWHPDGYLIAAHTTNGALYKIDLKKPDNITRVNTAFFFFPGADGLLWDTAGHLLIVQNRGVNKIYELHGNSNWQRAEINASTLLTDRFDFPTTATFKDGKPYALNAKLNELTDPTEPPSKEFSFQLVRLVPMR